MLSQLFRIVVVRKEIGQPFQQLDIFLRYGSPRLLQTVNGGAAERTHHGHQRVQVVELVEFLSDADEVGDDFGTRPDVRLVKYLLDGPETDVIEMARHGHDVRCQFQLVALAPSARCQLFRLDILKDGHDQ